MKIGLFYGSTTCYSEIAAEKIQEIMGASLVELHNIKDVSLEKTADYDILILGISTWDYGKLQEDWESHWSDISTQDLSNKVIALYGMGDQIGYGEWFQDALGMLHDEVAQQEVLIIGHWPNQDYAFEKSKALTPDGEYFVGLSLDEDNQYQLSKARITQWCAQLNDEINAILAS